MRGRTHRILALDGGVEVEPRDDQPLFRVLDEIGSFAEVIHNVEDVESLLLVRALLLPVPRCLLNTRWAPHNAWHVNL